MKVNKKVVIICIILSFVVAFLYASLYVLGNNDNANNTKNYQVGVINKDQQQLSKSWINKMKSQKDFKITYYQDEDKLKRDLSVADKMQLGIVIDKNFTQTINDTQKLTRKSQVTFIENSKISQMSTLINSNIINVAEEKLNELTSLVNSENVAKFIKEKIEILHSLTSQLKSEQQLTQSLYYNVNDKISYYENLIKSIKGQVSDIKSDLNFHNLKEIWKKLKVNASSLEQFKTQSPLQIINKVLNNQNLDVNKLVDMVPDATLKQLVKDYLQKLQSQVQNISTSLNVKNSNEKIYISKIISDFNNLYTTFNDQVSKMNINANAREVLNSIGQLKSNLDLMLMNLSQINFKNVDDLIANLKNESIEEVVRKIFNVDLKQVQDIISDLKKPQSQIDLQAKISKLKEGLSSLEGGITKFVNTIEDVQNKMDFDLIAKNAKKLYMLAQNPGNVNVKNITTKQTSGQAVIGFALMLGLWVLTLFTYEFILVDKNSVVKKAFWGSLLLTLFAIVHSLFTIMLNVYVSNVFTYILAFNLIGWTFYMIQLFFYKIFKVKAPVFLTLIFILMVVGSGATVPIELMSGVYNFIYKIDPLHYSVNIIRELSHSPNYDVVLQNALVVFYYFSGFGLLVLLIDFLQKRNKND